MKCLQQSFLSGSYRQLFPQYALLLMANMCKCSGDWKQMPFLHWPKKKKKWGKPLASSTWWKWSRRGDFNKAAICSCCSHQAGNRSNMWCDGEGGRGKGGWRIDGEHEKVKQKSKGVFFFSRGDGEKKVHCSLFDLSLFLSKTEKVKLNYWLKKKISKNLQSISIHKSVLFFRLSILNIIQNVKI